MESQINLGKVGFIFKGEWRADASYERLDTVSYEGSSYVCVEAITGQHPGDSSAWNLLAQKGNVGEQGLPFIIKGAAYDSLEALQAAVQDAQVGDQYNVGTQAPYNIYRWTGSAWEDQGQLQGPPGERGADGKPGEPGEDGKDGAPGENGATFTPSVDPDGNLTWTNDKGLPNPGTVNIKGKDGKDGKNGTDATVTRSDAAPQPLAAQAAAGDSDEVSRANHVHKFPTAAEVGAVAKDDTIPVDHGGTGATTAPQAVANLGASPAENGIWPCEHAKVGTVHKLTSNESADDVKNVRFEATADFKEGDTFSLDGKSFDAKLPNGEPLPDGFFVEGSTMFALVNEAKTTLYFIRGGGGDTTTPVTITLTATNSAANLIGVEVTVTDEDDGGATIKQFNWSGQPETVRIDLGVTYKVHCGPVDKCASPADVTYVAKKDPRQIVMTYVWGSRYGFKRDKNNSDPSERITYLYDAEGKDPLYVDLTTHETHWGDWKAFVDELVRPVMLRYDGTVDYELDHDDQTKRADNGEASDVANTAYEGNAMAEFRKYKWVKRYEDENYEYVIFSDVPYDGTYYAYAHTGEDGQVKDAFYWGMFKGTYVGTKMRSIGAGSVMGSTTRQTEIDRAQQNGSGYWTIYKSGWDYITDILTLISKSDHSQNAFGSGRTGSGNKNAIAVGSLKTYGAFYGYNNGTSDVKALYIEGIWGNVLESMAGFIHDYSSGFKIKMTPPYNTTGEGYEETGIKPTGGSGGTGYVDTEKIDEKLGYIPKTANGSGSTYLCDALLYRTGSGIGYALISSSWDFAAQSGSRFLAIRDAVTGAWSWCGSRLSYLPA